MKLRDSCLGKQSPFILYGLIWAPLRHTSDHVEAFPFGEKFSCSMGDVPRTWGDGADRRRYSAGKETGGALSTVDAGAFIPLSRCITANCCGLSK